MTRAEATSNRRRLAPTKDAALAVLSLFASTSTLLCCALPTLLVMIGLGAVIAGAVSALPWLVPLSQNKGWAFALAGLLIAGNWALVVGWDRRARAAAACAADGARGGESACRTASRFSRVVLWISTALYAIGFSVAYVAFPVGRAFGWL